MAGRPAPEGETAEQRFKRLGNQRISVVLRNLRAIGKLKGGTAEQAVKIRDLVYQEVDAMMTAIRRPGKQTDIEEFL